MHSASVFLTVEFTSQRVSIKLGSDCLFEGTYDPVHRLFKLDLRTLLSSPGQQSHHVSVKVFAVLRIPGGMTEKIKHYHQCLGCPPTKTFQRIVDDNIIDNFPISSADMRKYKLHVPQTAMGYFELVRQSHTAKRQRTPKVQLSTPSALADNDFEKTTTTIQSTSTRRNSCKPIASCGQAHPSETLHCLMTPPDQRQRPHHEEENIS